MTVTIHRRTTLLLFTALFAVCAHAQLDTDGDGVGDPVDNCVNVANALQRDTDGDGLGNACDADLNDDCIVNALDLGIFRLRFFSSDPDADFNGDGVVNSVDLGIIRLGFFQPPGPAGGQSLCSCLPPPPAVPTPNADFGGQPVFFVGSLAGNGAAVPGLNEFSDQGNGRYLARLYARAGGTFDYRVADASLALDYCSDAPLGLYAPLDLPNGGCLAPAGAVTLPAPGCYEFALQTDGAVPPADVELTVFERLARWDVQVDAGGGTFALPNGATLDVPPGAVAGLTDLSVGDVACAQLNALFAATELTTHDNRCIGGMAGEPAGLAFAAPVTLTLPVGAVTADETAFLISNEPGREDYVLVETLLNYDGTLGLATADIQTLAVFGIAAANKREAPPAARGGLPPCCSQTPTPPGCCCQSFSVTSSAGDAFDSSCDCQMIGNNIEIEFPSCPGAPVFIDNEAHASENCPSDFSATLSGTDLIQWTCETRTVSYALFGTNGDGQTCSMSIPLDWSATNPAIAQVTGNAVGTGADILGLTGGDTQLVARSTVGEQFSVMAPLSIIDLSGSWRIQEEAEQTCSVDGGAATMETDSSDEIVQVAVSGCATVSLMQGALGGFDDTMGALVTRMLPPPEPPFALDIDANGSSNTVSCFIFFVTAGQDIDIGAPFCPSGSVCEAIACTESVTTDVFVNIAAFGNGGGASTWSLDTQWIETVDGQPQPHSASCAGSSTLVLTKQ